MTGWTSNRPYLLGVPLFDGSGSGQSKTTRGNSEQFITATYIHLNVWKSYSSRNKRKSSKHKGTISLFCNAKQLTTYHKTISRCWSIERVICLNSIWIKVNVDPHMCTKKTYWVAVFKKEPRWIWPLQVKRLWWLWSYYIVLNGKMHKLKPNYYFFSLTDYPL